jgi:mRNA interferase MazF
VRRLPRRGEVWLVDLTPTFGHEQAGRRPAVIISEDVFNSGPAELVIVLPVTSTLRPIPSQVQLSPPDGGLDRASAVLCEAIRSISRRRLVRRLGAISVARLGLVEDTLRILLRL